MEVPMRRVMLVGLAAVLAVGCQSHQTPVRLQGDAVAIASLAGRWTGEYWGGAGGRAGSLAFTLRSGSDSLYGDVTMIDSKGRQLGPADPMNMHQMHVQSAQGLRIDFASIRADSVRGTLERYIAPDCDCVVTSTFFGRVQGDRITGRFETRNAGRVLAEGSWEMKRVGGGTS
jgi:hypothetical protein